MEFILPLSKLDEQLSATWKNWWHLKQRFKDFLVVTNEDVPPGNADGKLSSSLLMFISADKMVDILKVFTAKAVYENEAIEELLEVIEEICLPRFILLYERFKFFSFRQGQFVDFRKFVCELRMLGSYCELEEQEEELLTGRIVDGVYSEKLRTHLQSFSGPELENAIEVCVATEAGSLYNDLGVDNQAERSQTDKVVDSTAHILKEKKERCKNSLIENILPTGIGEKKRKSKRKQTSCEELYSRCDEENQAVCEDAAKIATQSKISSLGNSVTCPTRKLTKRRSVKAGVGTSAAEGNDQSRGKTKRETPVVNACQSQQSSIVLSDKVVGRQSQAKVVQDQNCDGTLASGSAANNEVSHPTELRSNSKVEVSDAQSDIEVGLETHNLKCGQTKFRTKGGKKPKDCPICGQTFATTDLLNRHTRMKSGQKLYNCGICDLSFIHCGSRSRHMRQLHPEVLKFPCSECDMLFERQKALDQHKLSHSKQQETTCSDCGVIFSSTREHFQHRRQVHRNTRYHCSICGLHFPYPSKLKLHLMSKHNATKPFMCEICGSSFSEKNLLTTHKNVHSGEKKHECSTCGRRFLLKTTLSNHLQIHLDRKPHTCDVCGLGFKLSYYLKSHMKTHSQNRDRPHICSKCGRAFLKVAQLRNHERKHTGEKPYKCDICNSVFSQLSSMKKHIRQIHEGLKPKERFSCEYCGLSFTHSCKLKLHLMKHTGERPFACKVCGSTYREKHQLATHTKIHDGSEPFKCVICQRRFLQKSSLESHVRKHTGEKPFKCQICFQQFSHKGYLRDHVKVHDQNRERKYKCGICDKAFTCSSHMRSHERLHLGEKPHKCDICGSRFTKRSSVKKHMRRTHGVQGATSPQVQGCLTEQKIPDMAHPQSVDDGQNTEQQGTGQPHGADRQSQAEQPHGADRQSQAGQPHGADRQSQAGQPHGADRQSQAGQPHGADRQSQAGQPHGADRQSQAGQPHGADRQSQAGSETRPELHVDLQPEIRPVLRVGIGLQMISSHLHPEASVQSHLQQNMFATLQSIHPAAQHTMYPHPSIHITHPEMNTGAHISGHSLMQPQITPAISSSLCTHVHHPEIVQEMHVYTMAS